MDILIGYALAFGTVFVYMTVLFAVAQRLGDNSIVDIAWGLGFVLVAAATLAVLGDLGARQVLITSIVAAWGLRLALHIAVRNHGRGEDPRYAKWREEWGDSFAVRSFLQVFMLQGVLLVVVASPVIFVNAQDGGAGLRWLDFVGAAAWAFGLSWEAVSDYQLLRFKRDPANRGKVMDRGLWRFSRHPNYFGEVVLWWGIYLVAVSAEHGWLSAIGPATITFLLLRVSGVAMLERAKANDPKYAEYRRRTSVFVPWVPRS
jgi:steroid 5-alpha reductase family enzyme